MGAERPGGRNRLPRARRLTKGPEITDVLRQGKRSGTVHLDIFHSSSPDSFTRVGWIVPRYGHTAVARNRVKRRLREMIRLELLPRASDGAALRVIVRAKRNAYDATYGELRRELDSWIERTWSRAS